MVFCVAVFYALERRRVGALNKTLLSVPALYIAWLLSTWWTIRVFFRVFNTALAYHTALDWFCSCFSADYSHPLPQFSYLGFVLCCPPLLLIGFQPVYQTCTSHWRHCPLSWCRFSPLHWQYLIVYVLHWATLSQNHSWHSPQSRGPCIKISGNGYASIV